MTRLLHTLNSVSSLLERLSNAACEDDPEACKDALRGVRRVSQDFELIRPILDPLILQPRGTWTRDSGELSRHLSAPPLHPATVPKDKPLLTSQYKHYVEAGVNAVEAFALMSDPAATAYFDAVLASGIQRGPTCCIAGEMLVKHMWYTGLELQMCDIKLSPSLLGKLATYASGKPENLKAVTRVLPELCQGVSPDELLQRVMMAKTQIRKGLLRRYMQALDESEGLQGITTRLSQRLGIDLDALHSDTALDIPWHVRQYLQKYERCTDDRKMLASLETQIIVLRAIGALEAEAKENASDSGSHVFSGSMNPFRLANNLAPTGGDSARIKAQTNGGQTGIYRLTQLGRGPLLQLPSGLALLHPRSSWNDGSQRHWEVQCRIGAKSVVIHRRRRFLRRNLARSLPSSNLHGWSMT
ncbi:hypothetical protein WJX75_007441 [Coccomyxa subellipsoidea]|uniref:Uncharacterized protein n=1 Tax=Coccomyxa subellipsoidea TaxID=248742 RepID=A0ABR2Z4E8_9CHLO